MTINLNNTIREISEQATIDVMLKEIGQASNGIAIAINNQVIRKDDWSNTKLNPNDNLLIIQATQGG